MDPFLQPIITRFVGKAISAEFKRAGKRKRGMKGKKKKEDKE